MMNHKDFFNVAVQINQLNEPNQINIRNSISRIYYFIYHEALQWIKSDKELLETYNSLVKMSSHKKVSISFEKYGKNCRAYTYVKIGKSLSILHKYRCNADYDLDRLIDLPNLNTVLAELQYLSDLTKQTNQNYFDVDAINYVKEKTTTLLNIESITKRSNLRVLD